MYCQHCHQANPDAATRCGACGQPLIRPAQPPAMPPALPAAPAEQPSLRGVGNSNVQPAWHFCLLSLCTLGLYEVYWMYKHWKWLKARGNLNVWPFWRAVFGVIWIFELAQKLSALTKERGVETSYSPAGMALCFVGLTLAHKLPDPYSLVSLLAFLPMLPMVKNLNDYWGREQAGLPERSLALKEIAVIVPGLIVVALAIVGTVMPTPEEAPPAQTETAAAPAEAAPPAQEEPQETSQETPQEEPLEEPQAEPQEEP